MKAEDLRLNNWVEIKDQDVKTYAQVEGIGNLQHVAGQLWSIEELEPIPLTEEWLTRFGFEIDYEGDYMLVWRGVVFYFKLSDMSLRRDYKQKNKLSIVPINYVHQLQNLLNTLTGEELTIKE